MNERDAHASASLDDVRGASTTEAAAEAAVDLLVAAGLVMPSVYFQIGGRMRCVAIRGYWQVVDGVTTGAGILGSTFQSGEPRIVQDVRTSPGFVAAVPGVVGEVCVPLRFEGLVVGALNVESPEPISDSDVERIKECAAALEERLAALGGPPDPSPWHELARRCSELNLARNPELIAALAVDAAVQFTSMSSAFVVLVEDDALEPIAAVGPLSKALETISAENLGSFAAWTSPTASTDTAADAQEQGLSGQQALRREGVEALVAVGLRAQKGLLGYLIVADSAPLRLPSEEVQRLELLAAHVGSALQTAATLAELQAQASRDALTGLGHNAAFHARLAAAQEREPTRDVAVLLLDVDGLKRINDTQGHAAGDEILAGVADVLDETLPESGRVFRVGGDEFAAVVHVDDEDDALAVAQRLCTAVKEQRHVTVSVGVATTAAADGSGQVDTLLADADLALYEAKRRGRSRVISYHPNLRAAVLERARLAAELSGAVRRDELHIVYQPVVALDSGDVVALEALVRWKHSSRGPVSPGEFIPIAEEDGQIIGIGDWVLEMACHQLDAWNRLRGDAFPLRMSVNVSGAQLTPSFDRMVRRVLADSGVPPPQLVLEMTERVFVDDPDALRVLQSLREHGVRIAIDDFGTGYSSFAYLRRLPLDVLKIDQSFVAEIGEPRNTAVAEAIVTLSNTLELITVAEGIERAEQVETLRAIGCGLGQGYHLARPADAESLTPALIAVQSMQP